MYGRHASLQCNKDTVNCNSLDLQLVSLRLGGLPWIPFPRQLLINGMSVRKRTEKLFDRTTSACLLESAQSQKLLRCCRNVGKTEENYQIDLNSKPQFPNDDS